MSVSRCATSAGYLDQVLPSILWRNCSSGYFLYGMGLGYDSCGILTRFGYRWSRDWSTREDILSECVWTQLASGVWRTSATLNLRRGLSDIQNDIDYVRWFNKLYGRTLAYKSKRGTSPINARPESAAAVVSALLTIATAGSRQLPAALSDINKVHSSLQRLPVCRSSPIQRCLFWYVNGFNGT
jgi:hypothetical protein